MRRRASREISPAVMRIVVRRSSFVNVLAVQRSMGFAPMTGFMMLTLLALSSSPVSRLSRADAASAPPIQASAPPTQQTATTAPISLRATLAQAIDGNPDLLRARAAIDTATAGIVSAEGAFDVVLSGDATVARRATPPVTSFDAIIGDSRTLTVDLGLSRALESGGSLSLAAQEVALQSRSPSLCGGAGETLCRTYSSNLSLTFTQPLLRGFGSQITLLNLREGRIQNDLQLLNRQATAALVVRDVVTAYWELAYAADDLEIRHAAVRLAEEQRKATQIQVDVGRLGQAELAAVDRAIADRLQEVVIAEQASIGRGLDIERLVGHAVPADFTPPVAAEHAQPGAAVEFNARAETEHALAASPQLKALRAGQQISELELWRANALLRPRLDFTATLTSVGKTRDDLGQSWGQVGRFDTPNGSAGVVFQWPLQNRSARGAELAASAAEDLARVNAHDLELGIRDSVVRLGAAMRAAARRGELARDAVKYAEINLEAERARFGVGQSTNNDVLLRQQELKTAQIQIARAATDLIIAEVDLAAVTADILDRYQIRLRGL
jgi:outer membrane protein